ncbi:MAG TPA: hypothetical protein VNE39_04190 [Planctomycetota bacterium]|nr:hypothetical protein [Planctomycetota bacterium]
MRNDGPIVLLLVLGTALYAATMVAWAPQPFEDAAILMRYAEHVAEGHGIVWNVGEPPVDGATDFLFMMLVAGLRRGGLPAEDAVRGLCLAAHLATVVIVYVAVRKLHGSRQWMAALSAAYLAVGPGMAYTSAGFGTPFFALFACLTWVLANRLVLGEASGRASLLFALSGLAMGLIRPEGVFLAAFMLAAVVFMRGVRRSLVPMAWFVGVFAVLGGAYFAWRWSYFGYPLPNPFYKKGGGALHWDGLKSALHGALRFSLPFTLPFLAAFRSRETARQAVFALIPMAGFVGLWVLLSDEMNYHWRFQYAIQPIFLLSWPPLVEGLFVEWHLPAWRSLARRSRVLLSVLGGVVFLFVLTYHHRMARLPILYADGNAAVAKVLHDFRGAGYTMAVSEAGLLPFYSGWRAIDTWGLNDPEIAHSGGITEERLARESPHLIAFHAYFSPLVPPVVRNEWDAMVVKLKDHAERRGYVLAAVFGETPYDTQHFYVRPDFPDSAEIIRRIRATPYIQMSTGRPCLNYADAASLLKPSER